MSDATVASLSARRRVPPTVNEPIRSYAPGTPERASLKTRLASMATEHVDVPVIVNGKEYRTGDTAPIVMPHDHQHVLGTWHKATPELVQEAIATTAAARVEWSRWPWEDRVAVFLRAAELLSTTWRDTLNAATMLGQSKTAFQSEIDAACELIDFFRFGALFAQDLYGEMAETAHTEHHHTVAGSQQRRGALACPVGGEAGIGERAQLRQVGVGPDAQHRPFVGEQVLGVAAVDRDARSAAVGRMGVEAGAFRRAEPATDEGEADDRIAHRHRGDLGTDLVHPAGVLVAEHQRQRCSHLAGEQVQVGAAHAGCRNTHHDIERTDRTRCGHLVEAQRRGRQRSLHRVHSHCPHERHPPDLAPCGGARKS